MPANEIEGRRAGPPLALRLIGRAMTEAVARVPGAWRVVRGPTQRFFAGAAAGWDDRVRPDGDEHLAALVAAVERLEASPQRSWSHERAVARLIDEVAARRGRVPERPARRATAAKPRRPRVAEAQPQPVLKPQLEHV